MRRQQDEAHWPARVRGPTDPGNPAVGSRQGQLELASRRRRSSSNRSVVSSRRQRRVRRAAKICYSSCHGAGLGVRAVEERRTHTASRVKPSAPQLRWFKPHGRRGGPTRGIGSISSTEPRSLQSVKERGPHGPRSRGFQSASTPVVQNSRSAATGPPLRHPSTECDSKSRSRCARSLSPRQQ
jgi:hypothetical protein